MLVKLDHFPKFCTSCHHLASLLPQKLTTWNLKMMFPILGLSNFPGGNPKRCGGTPLESKRPTQGWGNRAFQSVFGPRFSHRVTGDVTVKTLGRFFWGYQRYPVPETERSRPLWRRDKNMMNLMRYFKSSYDFSLQVGPFVGHRHARSTKKMEPVRTFYWKFP